MRSSITRRELLVAGAAPLLAVAPERIAAQTYIFMQASERDPERICATAAEAGFRTLELMSDFITPEMSAAMRRHGLAAPIVYTGGPMHDAVAAKAARERALAVADAARNMGILAVNTNPDPKPKRERKSDAELAVQADSLNRLGEELRKRGLRLLYHTHAPEMAENAREWREMLRRTDAALVSFCMDIHWIHRGGRDPVQLLREAGSRTASLHVRNSSGGVWTESVGPGDVDYRPVADELVARRLRPWIVVELAWEKGTPHTRSLAVNLRRSREWTADAFRRVG